MTTYFTSLAGAAVVLCLALLLAALPLQAQDMPASQLQLPVRNPNRDKPDSAKVGQLDVPDTARAAVADHNLRSAVLDEHGDTVRFTAADSLRLALKPDTLYDTSLGRIKVFNPDPMRDMWL